MPTVHFKTLQETFYIDVPQGRKPKVEDIQKALMKLGYTPAKDKWGSVKYLFQGKELVLNSKNELECSDNPDCLLINEPVTVWNVVKLSKGCEDWKSIVICYPSDIAISFRQLSHMMTAVGMLEYSVYGDVGDGDVGDGFRKLEIEEVSRRRREPLPFYVKAVYKPDSTAPVPSAGAPSAGAGYGSWRHGKRKSKKQTTLRHKKRSRSLSSKSPKRRQRKKRTMSKRRQRR